MSAVRFAVDACGSAALDAAVRGLAELAAGRAVAPRLWWPPGLPACMVELSPVEALDRDPAASGEPADGGSAQAAPAKVNIAAPVPKATASPPTRPTNFDDVTDISALLFSSGSDAGEPQSGPGFLQWNW